MSDNWIGTIGKGHNEPDRPWVHPREWCRQRALYYLNKGEYGNAYGQLVADLARDEETKLLLEKLRLIPYGIDHLRNFVELNLKQEATMTNVEWEWAGISSNVGQTTDGRFELIEDRSPSDWQVRHGNMIYRPFKGDEPNWFHRWMQRLAFGFRWERVSNE